MTVFVGMDGYARGWVAIAIDERGFVEARCDAAFAPLLSAFSRVKTFGVDMPIGLVDAPQRDADQAARQHLPGAASSVFNAPARAVLAATDYAQANAISMKVARKGLSRQAFAIVEKIREVDLHVRDERIFEVHPEVSFRVMSEGRPLGRKKTWGGLQARLARLAEQGIVLPVSLGAADEVGIDDVVDAAAAAWSARRIARGTAIALPDPATQRDASGRRIAIWA